MSLNFNFSFIHSRDWFWSEIAGMQIWQASKLALSRKVTDNHSISLPIHARKQVVLFRIFHRIGIDHPRSTLTHAGLALTLDKNAGMQTLTKNFIIRGKKRDKMRKERNRSVLWLGCGNAAQHRERNRVTRGFRGRLQQYYYSTYTMANRKSYVLLPIPLFS